MDAKWYAVLVVWNVVVSTLAKSRAKEAKEEKLLAQHAHFKRIF